MHADRSRDVLRLLERAAIEHLTWLMRVHAALMFPGDTVPPSEAALPEPCPSGCGEFEELHGLERARGVMLERARDLLTGTTCQPDPDAYRAFMAAVDAYAREARRAEGHFRRLLLETDPLTGVANRQGMMRDLRREWTRVLRTGRPACLALADLDFFKLINDTHGHAVGDRVLCATAGLFRHALRPYDLVFRFGGEEFLFCLPDTSLATARRVLDRLCRQLGRNPVTLDDGTALRVTTSIGVAELVPDRTVQDSIEAADRALYAAKEAGRNRVAVSNPPAPARAAAGRQPQLQGALRL